MASIRGFFRGPSFVLNISNARRFQDIYDCCKKRCLLVGEVPYRANPYSQIVEYAIAMAKHDYIYGDTDARSEAYDFLLEYMPGRNRAIKDWFIRKLVDKNAPFRKETKNG